MSNTSEKTIEEITLAVLSTFIKAREDFGDYSYINYKYLTNETGYEKEQIEPVIKDLKSRELLVFGTGLWTEDGEMAGSGWTLEDLDGAEQYKKELEYVVKPVYTEAEVQKKCEEYLDGFLGNVRTTKDPRPLYAWTDVRHLTEDAEQYKTQKREEVQG